MRGAARIRKLPDAPGVPEGTVEIAPSDARAGDHVRFRKGKSWLWVTQVGYGVGRGPEYDGDPPLVWFMTATGSRPAPRPATEVIRACRSTPKARP